MIVCPGCGAVGEIDRALEESAFRWSCTSCAKAFDVRIVFLPRAHPIDAAKFRAEIHRLLAEQHLTKTELARLVGVSPAYISTLLSGRRAVGAEVAARIARALNARSNH